VPGINDKHIATVAETVAAAGASLINIIPLIPQFELSYVSPPDFIQVNEARHAAGNYLNVFTHCNRCRADACGIPGENDYSSELYGEPIAEATFSHG
jgi:nitrogen fixation protein NifB